MFKKIRNKATSITVKAQTAIANKIAEGYVDSDVKILIAVVIGAFLLGRFYALFNITIMPTVTSKITSLFSYSG